MDRGGYCLGDLSLLVSVRILVPTLARLVGARGKRNVPMSVRGKTAMGFCLVAFGTLFLFGNTTAWPVLLAVWAVIMIAMIPVWWRDYRDSEGF